MGTVRNMRERAPAPACSRPRVLSMFARRAPLRRTQAMPAQRVRPELFQSEDVCLSRMLARCHWPNRSRPEGVHGRPIADAMRTGAYIPACQAEATHAVRHRFPLDITEADLWCAFRLQAPSDFVAPCGFLSVINSEVGIAVGKGVRDYGGRLLGPVWPGLLGGTLPRIGIGVAVSMLVNGVCRDD